MVQYRATKVPGRLFSHIDWFLFAAALAISLLGLATMRSFSAQNDFFDKQIIWISLSVIVFFLASIPDYSFLRRTQVLSALYGIIIFVLALVFIFGSVVKGAQNRFNFGLFFVQPSDP